MHPHFRGVKNVEYMRILASVKSYVFHCCRICQSFYCPLYSAFTVHSEPSRGGYRGAEFPMWASALSFHFHL